jgi:hypothetical protein
MNRRRLLQLLPAGALVVSIGCSDQNEPTAPNAPKPPPLEQVFQGTADNLTALAGAVPGFGGFYLDDSGNPFVYLKNASQRGKVERVLAPFFRSEGLSPSQLRVLPARYEWAELESWYSKFSSEGLATRGAVFVDADEASNRVTIGVERGAKAHIQGVLARLGIPKEAVVLRETEPIHFAVTLRNRVRPVQGGLQINFPGLHPTVNTFICSIGFNATRNGQRSFITASHCTNRQGGVESTPYYQPLQTSTSPKIATEVSDPAYFTGNGCPAGMRCRFSDAARAAYAAATSSTLGRIAKTTGPNNGSITISGSLNITAEGRAAVGQVVGKVGRTTGWSTGKVTNTCVNVAVSGSNIGLFCQNIVSARLGAGDSGSPVFRGSSNVTLVGILWGGNSTNTQFVYSPMSGIEHELGALTTF